MTFFSQNVVLWCLAAIGALSLTIYVAKKTRQFFGKYGRLVVDAVFWGAERYTGPKIRTLVSMKRYCQVWLNAEETKFLKVPGKRNVSLPVDDVFVPLSLEIDDGKNTTYTHANLLDVGRRLLIIGDPGSGKSTLVKWLFRDICEQARKKPFKWYLPIQLELRSLNPPDSFEDDAEAGAWLLARLREKVTAVKGFEMGEFFDSIVNHTGLLVLLDGLDEVSRERYAAVAASLRGLAALLTGRGKWNSVVVTMRSQFHQQIQDELADAYPQTLHVRPFTPNEIYVFLRRWPFAEKDRSEVERIYADLSDRPTLREMCTNPLVLAMYVVHHRESQRPDLPDTRTEFYRSVVTELLVTRRRRQTGDDHQGRRRRSEREAILGELAYTNLIDDTQPANSLSWDRAVTVASRVWQCDSDEAWDRLKELSAETGIFEMERLDETFRFIHLTFCEFLAAVYAVEHKQNGWQALLDKHQAFAASTEPQVRARLVEIIPFAHGLMHPVNRPEVLTKVAALGAQLVLGRCFLETQMYDRPEWELYFEAEKAYLTSREEADWDTPQLSRLQLFTVVVRDQLSWSDNTEGETRLADLFADIVKGNRGVLVKVFSSYARQDATAAFRLADHIGVDMLEEHPQLLIECCQDNAFLSLAAQRLTTDGDERWRPILAEASLLFIMAQKRLVEIKTENRWSMDSQVERRVSTLARSHESDSLFVVCLERTLLRSRTDEFPAVDLLRANLRPLARTVVTTGFMMWTALIGLPASLALVVVSLIFDWATVFVWLGIVAFPAALAIAWIATRILESLDYILHRLPPGGDNSGIVRKPCLFRVVITVDRVVRKMAVMRGEVSVDREQGAY